VVALLDPRDAGPDLLDDARALVPEHHRQSRLEVTVRDVYVGVAQPRVRVADQHLPLPRPVEVELLDLDRLAGLVHHCGGGFHGASWVLGVRRQSSRRLPGAQGHERTRTSSNAAGLSIGAACPYGAAIHRSQKETAMNPESAPASQGDDQSAEQDVVTAESLIEEVSIDGMCGVY
jgi:mycofactocin precursor